MPSYCHSLCNTYILSLECCFFPMAEGLFLACGRRLPSPSQGRAKNSFEQKKAYRPTNSKLSQAAHKGLGTAQGEGDGDGAHVRAGAAGREPAVSLAPSQQLAGDASGRLQAIPRARPRSCCMRRSGGRRAPGVHGRGRRSTGGWITGQDLLHERREWSPATVAAGASSLGLASASARPKRVVRSLWRHG